MSKKRMLFTFESDKVTTNIDSAEADRILAPITKEKTVQHCACSWEGDIKPMDDW